MKMVSVTDGIKYLLSMGLLTFSIVIVMALIFKEDTKISRDFHPGVAAVVFWAGICWMSMVEGGQCSMVGLPPVNRNLYEQSHPITHKVTSVGHHGDNLDRYLIGRQFMVIFIAFTINLCGAPLDGVNALGLPDMVQSIFLGSGIAMILITVMVGQLTAQVNASHCMLDYINTHFMTVTLWVALTIEKTGVMHTCYLVQMLFYKLAGKPVESNEPPRTAIQNLFFWGRCIMSVAILAFSLAVTVEALFDGKTTMWESIPNGVAVILFFLLMAVVGMLEGMQIAFFAVTKMPRSAHGTHPVAVKTCGLLFGNGGRNLPGFMVGRQMCVTLCFFVIARVTTINVQIGAGENIFGVSDSIQNFFNMGFLGALITTILASISWQLVASAFPIQFLSNPLVYILLRWCLFLEATGICYGAWFLGAIHKKIAGFEADEVYIGTTEERAALEKDFDDTSRGHSDAETNHHQQHHYLGTNGVLDGVPDAVIRDFDSHREVFAERRQTILSNIKLFREELENAESDPEREAFQRSIKMEIMSLTKLNEEQLIIESTSLSFGANPKSPTGISIEFDNSNV